MSEAELRRMKARIDERAALDKKLQILLALSYRDRLRAGQASLPLSEVEFRTFSQNGEDGILQYIFAVIGTHDRRAVEICAGDGIECNTANLIINHGWKGLLVDGQKDLVRKGTRLYAMLADTFIRPPTFVHAWITADNVNQIIQGSGFAGELDLLSLDLDGVDYWIWKAIDCVQPRVLVVEYNGLWSDRHAVSVPYRPDFRLDFSRVPLYCGASLGAFVKLGHERGYRLIGCERNQVNAFFVRADVASDLLPEVPAAQCLSHAIDDYDWGERVWVPV
jgi:hypothetical protein